MLTHTLSLALLRDVSCSGGLLLRELEDRASGLRKEVEDHVWHLRKTEGAKIHMKLSVRRKASSFGPQLHWITTTRLRVGAGKNGKPLYATRHVSGLRAYRYRLDIFNGLDPQYRPAMCEFERRAAEIREAVALVGILVRSSVRLMGADHLMDTPLDGWTACTSQLAAALQNGSRTVLEAPSLPPPTTSPWFE